MGQLLSHQTHSWVLQASHCFHRQMFGYFVSVVVLALILKVWPVATHNDEKEVAVSSLHFLPIHLVLCFQEVEGMDE